jgi:hypothetical protein
MGRAVDSFWLDLTLHHPTCAPSVITEALGLHPWHSAKVGQTIGTTTKKSTVWMSLFCEGIKSEEFTQALEDLISLIKSREGFLKSFIDEGGDILLTLNQSVAIDDGILFNLHLEPFFVKLLGDYGIGLQVRAWSAESKSAATDH